MLPRWFGSTILQDLMAYPPNAPLMVFKGAPEGDHAPDAALRHRLPRLDHAHTQLMLGQMLGGLLYTRLGDYDELRPFGRPWFRDERVAPALAAFKAALASVEERIQTRNTRRLLSYPYLLPSRIPRSVNI